MQLFYWNLHESEWVWTKLAGWISTYPLHPLRSDCILPASRCLPFDWNALMLFYLFFAQLSFIDNCNLYTWNTNYIPFYHQVRTLLPCQHTKGGTVLLVVLFTVHKRGQHNWHRFPPLNPIETTNWLLSHVTDPTISFLSFLCL